MGRTTSVTLGGHFARFVDEEVASGRFASASDVVRAGLRLLEEHEMKVRALSEALIDAGAANLDPPAIDPDPRLADLAAHRTFVEPNEDDIARLKVRLEHVDDRRLRRLVDNDITRLKARRNAKLRRIAGPAAGPRRPRPPPRPRPQRPRHRRAHGDRPRRLCRKAPHLHQHRRPTRNALDRKNRHHLMVATRPDHATT